MRICYFCKQPVPGEGRISRQDLCPHCRSDLHCCLNCTFFDESAANKCREPAAEWVSDREKNNFCEFFSFREESSLAAKSSAQQKAWAELEALFKKKNS